MAVGKAVPWACYARHPQRGFTLIAVLMAMFLLALATQGVLYVLSQQAQREREAELLKVGSAIVRAIGTYYESTPGSVKRWPRSLEELTDDKRFVTLRRHLRSVYLDPITRDPSWGLVSSADGGIAGVYSLSQQTPIRSGGAQAGDLTLPPAAQYADWRFVYVPGSLAVGTPSLAVSPTAPPRPLTVFPRMGR